MNPQLRTVWAVSLAAALATSGCDIRTGGRDADHPEASPLQLRVYAVPPGSAQQLRGVLNQVFWLNDKTPPSARVTVGADGRLVVMAPEGIQSGVAALIKDLGNVAPAPKPAIEMKYWLVLGHSGEGAVPAELSEIAPALQAVSKAQGGLVFEPLESLSIRSASDEEGEARGRSAKVKQTASVRDGKVDARLHIDAGLDLNRATSVLETRLELSPDQTLVLGETGIEIQPGDIARYKLSNEPRKLFYVVKPTIIASAKTP